MRRNILKLCSSLLVLTTIFVACSGPEGVIYNSEDRPEMAFAGKNLKVELLSADGNKFAVQVYRGNTAGQESVQLTLTLDKGVEEGLFTLTTPTVTFKDGESVAEAIISYDDIDALSASDSYQMSLAFDESKASPSKINSIKISAQRKLTFKSIGIGKYYSTFFGNEDGSPQIWDQEVEKAEEANVYRLPDCYALGFPIMFSVDDNGNVNSFATQETGYVHSEYGMVSVWYADSEKEGNTYNFLLTFRVSAGSFGDAIESIELPK